MAYATEAGIKQVFGTTNVNKWADLDDTDVAADITARIAQAVLVADAMIDDVARLSQYKHPLQDTDGNTPTTVADLANKLAGLWLYEARGAQDFDPKTGTPYHRFGFLAVRVRRMLHEIRTNQIELNAVKGA